MTISKKVTQNTTDNGSNAATTHTGEIDEVATPMDQTKPIKILSKI